MAITHSSAIRTELAGLIRDSIDAGAGAGKCVILSPSNVVLATIPWQVPCGTVTGATLTFTITAAQQDPAIDQTGTAAKFSVQDSDNNEVFAGSISVTGGSGDMTVSSTAFVQGSPVNITGATYTASL